MTRTSVSLPELQRVFASSLLDSSGNTDAALLDQLVPGGSLDAAGALDVYRRGYPIRLIEQLGETFEGVWWTLGDEEFFRLCREFIEGQRSVSYNLSDYGREFPDFLMQSSYLREAPFLPELARFELAFTELFHEAEHSHLTAAEVTSGLGAPSVKLVFGGAMFLRHHEFGVHRLWRLRKGHQEEAATVDWRKDERLLGYKLGGEIFLRELDPASFAALQALERGDCLGDALSSVASLHPEFAADAVQALFANVFQAGIVTRVES